MIDLNNFSSINLSQFFDSVKFRSGSGSGYHLVIDFCIVIFYMLMILMKFSFVPQTFFNIFFFSIRIRISLWNSLEKVILYIVNISTKFGVAPQSPQQKSTYRQTYRQTDGQMKKFFLLVLERIVFYSCDYNTFSFYILRMSWDSKKEKYGAVQIYPGKSEKLLSV